MRFLFRRSEPAVAEVEGLKDELTVAGEFPKFTPAELFQHFTDAKLLTKWWPETAEVALRPGGKYVLSWPKMGWVLLGSVKGFEVGKSLSFTWKWKHEGEKAVERLVSVTFTDREGGGANLRLTHGKYADTDADREERAGHLQGWKMMLTRLRDLRE